MLAAYHLNLFYEIISANNTLAKLSNNMRIKVTSGNSVKWIILWVLEQTKLDVLWICIQCFDRIGFIKVLAFPVRIFLSFLCRAEPTVPGNDLFCSLSLGEDYAVSLLYPASVIKHLVVYHWLYLCSWDKLESAFTQSCIFLDNLHCPRDSRSGCSESAGRQTSKDLGERKAQALSHKGSVGATCPDHLALRTWAQPLCRI